jgi:hypothetical protein
LEFFQKSTKIFFEGAGKVVGAPIKVIGEKSKSPYITDIGETVVKASNATGHTLGQAFSGISEITKGVIQKDSSCIQHGIGNIKESSVTTAKGIGLGIIHTASSATKVVNSVRVGNSEQAVNGLKELGKVAVVSALVAGTVDVIDNIVDFGNSVENTDNQLESSHDPLSPEQVESDQKALIETRNDSFNGTEHPETGVLFEEKTLTLPSGEVVTGVFPDFQEVCCITIPDWMYEYSDAAHFSYSNMQLSYELSANPQLASEFTNEQIAQISAGITPDGYTWHHSEEPGRLELVEQGTHAKTGHTGGRELWGGGEEHR